MELIIGNKNYSSWSLRAWLMLKAFDIPFKETKLLLFTEEFYTRLGEYGAADKVPVLLDKGVTVWDSLAICEYINEVYLQGNAWPEDKANRAVARSISNEMHSGFFAVRNELPMNCRAKRKVDLSAQAQKEIQRIDDLWSSLTARHTKTGVYPFGAFSIADVMYAPVVLRFRTYGIQLSAGSQAYCDAIYHHPAIQNWLENALLEMEIVAEDEAGEEVL